MSTNIDKDLREFSSSSSSPTFAVLISGQMRHFEVVCESYLSNFKNCKIFIYTSKCNILKLSYHKNFVSVKSKDDVSNDISRCFEGYDVAVKFVEDNKELHEKLFNDRMGEFETEDKIQYNISMIDQFLRVNLCFEMIKKYEQDNGMKFDFIIKLRPDSVFIGNLNLELFSEKDAVYVYQYPRKVNIVDFFFVCGRKVADKVFDAYKDMGKFVDKSKESYKSAEGQLELYLDKCKIKKNFLTNINPYWSRNILCCFRTSKHFNSENELDKNVVKFFDSLTQKYEKYYESYGVKSILDLNIFFS